MYVDEYRLRKGARDRAPRCTHDGCRYRYPNKPNRIPVHSVSTKGCINYDEYLLDKAVRGVVKNSPIKEDGIDEPPF